MPLLNQDSIRRLFNMALPLVDSMTTTDLTAHVGFGGKVAMRAGAVLVEVGEVLQVSGEALLDGHLTEEEINKVLDEADDVPAAVNALQKLIADGVGNQT